MRPTPLSLTAAWILSAACLIALSVRSTGLRAQATAQAPSVLTRGTRVRLTAPALSLPDRTEGKILALRNDTMVVRLEGLPDSLALPLAYLATVEVSQGRHPAVGIGIAAGLVLGGLAGALVGAVAYQEPQCARGRSPGTLGACFDFGRGGNAVFGGILGGLAGMVVGGIIGRVHGSEAWQPVHLGRTRTESRLGLGLELPSGARSGPGLSLALRF